MKLEFFVSSGLILSFFFFTSHEVLFMTPAEGFRGEVTVGF